jgi:hypothetical protein
MSAFKQQLAASPDRWTVLSYDLRPFSKRYLAPDLKGRIPESWLCVDCGVNTAPGLLTRKEMEAALIIHETAEQWLSDDQEVYCLKPEVWRAAGLEDWGGCLCIGCLEKRIGRRLKRGDFLEDHPFNHPDYPATPRLRKRRGRA